MTNENSKNATNYQNYLGINLELLKDKTNKNLIYLNESPLLNITKLDKTDFAQVHAFSEIFFSLILLLFQYTGGYTDLHLDVLGETEMTIRGRKDQKLYVFSLTEVMSSVFEKFGNILLGYFGNYKEEALNFYVSEFQRIQNLKETEQEKIEKMIELLPLGNMKTGYEHLIYNQIVKGVYNLTGRNFSEFLTISTSERLTIDIWEEEKQQWKTLNYRLEFIPARVGLERSYTLVTRLLDTKEIKPNYGVYQDLILDKLELKGITMLGGKTNSGKSTTIYSFLKSVYKRNKNKHFYSIEDPVEQKLPYVAQFQIFENKNDPSKNFLIPHHLKSFVRGDGDYVFVGEIRDLETVKGLIDLSNMGWGIFTTFHISNYRGLKERLKGFGADYNVVIDNLNVLISQQLIPRYKNGLVKIKEAEDENNLLLKGLKEEKKGKTNAIIENMFETVKQYETNLKNNILYPGSEYEEQYKKLLKALENKKNFVEFLSENFYFLDNTKEQETNGMVLVYEPLIMGPIEKEVFKENREDKFLKDGHKTFLPHFINGLILYQNELVNFNDMKQLFY